MRVVGEFQSGSRDSGVAGERERDASAQPSAQLGSSQTERVPVHAPTALKIMLVPAALAVRAGGGKMKMPVVAGHSKRARGWDF